jgi:hypothetical protein
VTPNILAAATAHFDNTTIVGSSPVTEWTNKGIGGATYSMTNVIGTAANLTRTTENSLDAVAYGGGVGLESSSQIAISKSTQFVVIKLTSSASTQMVLDAKPIATGRHLMWWDSSGNWQFYQGSVRAVADSPAGLLRLITVEFNSGGSSKLTVDGVGSVSGSVGSQSNAYGSLGMANSGGSTITGIICEYVMFDSDLSAGDITDVQDILRTKWFP